MYDIYLQSEVGDQGVRVVEMMEKCGVKHGSGTETGTGGLPNCFSLSHVNPNSSSTMNGFSDQGLDEGAFGESKATSVVKAFDAFRTCHSLLPGEHPRLKRQSILADLDTQQPKLNPRTRQRHRMEECGRSSSLWPRSCWQ